MNTEDQTIKTKEAPEVKPETKPENRGPRPAGRHFKGERSKDFDQKIIDIRRVTRVMAGGRRMSFAVSILIGDRKGSVGLGTGKAGDTALAINKAVRSAKKEMFKVKVTKESSIPFETIAKYKSARIMLRPNRARGLVAGSSARDILKLAGLKDVTTKILSGSKNKLNIARATLKALKQF